MTVKIDPGAQVNTIPLRRYQKLFPYTFSESRYPEPGLLRSTSHTWISHDSKPKTFLGHFIADVNDSTEPRSYPTHYYVFEDATSFQILLSYATSERLGILEFKVPNLAAQSHIDTMTVTTSPTPGGLRKTAKCVSFKNPLIDLNQPHHATLTHSSLRKTTHLKVSFSDPCKSTVNDIQCKRPQLMPYDLSKPLSPMFCSLPLPNPSQPSG